MIRKVVDDFPIGSDVDKKRESISGLSDPFFWKVKTERWRGAVYVDANSQAWLVAAGLRYEREPSKDFYQRFMTSARADVKAFLPSADDRALLLREVNENRILARESAIEEWALSRVREARDAANGLSDGELTFADRDGRVRTLAKVTFLLAPPEVPGEPYELLIELEIVDWEHQRIWEWDEQVILAAISSCEGSWGTTVRATRMHSIDIVSEEELDALCHGDRSATRQGRMSPGAVTHTVHRKRLTESVIEGQAVKAVCGKWFVPRQDHTNLPMCQTCVTLDAFMGISPEDLQGAERRS